MIDSVHKIPMTCVLCHCGHPQMSPTSFSLPSVSGFGDLVGDSRESAPGNGVLLRRSPNEEIRKRQAYKCLSVYHDH